MLREDFSNVIKAVKHPAKVTIAVVKDDLGKNNLITLEWFMRTSINPPMFAISIGHPRYSYECLQNFRFFNLCFPSKEMKDFTLLCGTKSGRDIDKLSVSKESWFKGKLAQLPILKNAVANFECKTITQIRSGDHTIFVGEVKYSWLSKGKKMLFVSDIIPK
ncbi:MAG: flavin reductase family protein [Candidatus Cloacimonetes bacterium]|nr:flavin reductase family protein [Candidatus Cloacimonadota bacterium]